ncbi:MAG TPA: hypothetical protein VMV57_01865 [Terracidiphilus sp.]|nr:hypothetical protein [Terracidiphilus sp.]
MAPSHTGSSGLRPARFAARLGWWSAVAMVLCTVAAFAIGIATPPRSGTFCVQNCIAYPYTDAAPFFPRDYLWMYPGLLLTPLFLVLVACTQSIAEEGKQTASRIGLCFATIAAAIVTMDYLLQLEVIAPSLMKGETIGVALFTQYNPHGIFIALEDLGYLMLSAAFLFTGVALSRTTRLERVLRWILVGSSLLAFASYLGLAWIFGPHVDYRFEITVISIDWTVLVLAGGMLSVLFRRVMRKSFE